MSKKTFGSKPKTIDEITAEIYELVGVKFPLRLTVVDGKIREGSYDTTWKEGTTTPVKNRKTKQIEYKENYKEKSLSKDQIAKLDAYLDKNVASD